MGSRPSDPSPWVGTPPPRASPLSAPWAPRLRYLRRLICPVSTLPPLKLKSDYALDLNTLDKVYVKTFVTRMLMLVTSLVCF